MGDFPRIVEKLCEASKKEYANPYSAMEWPEALDPEQWFMSPELLSIYGMPEYERLTEGEKKRLSFYETVNFFSLNIHGEKSLVEGLARQLYQRGNQELAPYLHHFLDEENKHMIYFGGFCTRYAGKIYRDRKMVFPREYAPGEERFLFFAKVVIFEEIVDVYNVKMAKDARLVPVARQIHLSHHRDEMRHLVFGRNLVKELFHRNLAVWSPEVVQGVRHYLMSYFSATWKEYYNPDVYKDAGLEEPYRLQAAALENPRARAHRKKISEGCIRYFLENNILEEEPVL
jgi:hypothetical protein